MTLERERVKHARDLKDLKEAYDMNLNEAKGTLRALQKRNERLEADARTARASSTRFKAAALTATDEARDARRAYASCERELRVMSLRCSSLERQMAILSKDCVARVAYDVVCARAREQEQQIAELLEQLAPDEPEVEEGEVEEDEGDGTELEQGSKEAKATRTRLRASTARKLRESCGIGSNRLAPPRHFNGDKSSRAGIEWCKLSIKHIKAVVEGRPMDHILAAMARPEVRHPKGRLGEMCESPRFIPYVKSAIRTAINKLSAHWTPRLAVHLWDRLELSRDQTETLRHLLSFTYNPVEDEYIAIRVWENPTNPDDCVNAPCIPGRYAREKLFNTLVDAAEITVASNGRCERDAVRCVSQLYSRFHAAMRDDFSDDRPARPILYFDGTGGSLGKGITHAEIGSADFAGECKQSRATLMPLALYQGSDHALPLRANLSLSLDTFNALIKQGSFTTESGAHVPCEPIVVGDMQGVKCMMGMAESCHSVWCKCRARAIVDEGHGQGPQHRYGEPTEQPFKTYDDVLECIDSIGCEFKTEEFLLACAHLSKGLVDGKRFTPFTCPECGYSPTAREAQRDLSAFQSMTDAEQKAARKVHVANGAHWHIELYMGPMTRGLGMSRIGADNLHLIYLNFFKHIFKYTVSAYAVPCKLVLTLIMRVSCCLL